MTQTTLKRTAAVPKNHEVRYEFKHLCFFLAECICGKTMWATTQRELNEKWKEHLG